MIQQTQPLSIITTSPDQTESVGARLGALLCAGDLVTLSGELGGGKTCFVRGIVQTAAPGCSDQVASPTYALMHEYGGAVPVYHFDCYRLRDTEDAYALGMQEHLQGDGICLVEWPERISDMLPDERLEICFQHADDDQRQLTFSPHGPRALQLVSQLSQMT